MNFIDRLLGRKKKAPTPDRAKTAPLHPKSEAKASAAPVEKRIVVGLAQSTGLERTHNEDSLFVIQGSAAGVDGLPDFGLFVVADGMGGHRSGEVASSISVRTVARRLTAETILHLFDLEPDEAIEPLQDQVRQALEEANLRVVERVPGGGTTLTAVVMLGQQLTVGHVGDSRAYIINDREARAITRDHSLVKRLEELGQLKPEEAEVHPQRNVLYRAIGQGANLEVDVFTQPVPRKASLLLCSDGLWGVVPDSVIRGIVCRASTPQAACEELVRAANAAGGPDNITAVLVQFPSEWN